MRSKKRSLVYDKHSKYIIGFTDIGEINNQLADRERVCSNDTDHAIHKPIALMVRGIFTSLRFSYAHFPVTNVKGEDLFTIIWEAIERLENNGLKVTVIVGDGASVNLECMHQFPVVHLTILCTRS